MARNKHPEETVALIMDVAARLFAEKGFDKTSLQDIIDETKLSKGAIYHHFVSKEDIFIRICDRIGMQHAAAMRKVRDSNALNGQQKLKEIYRKALLSGSQKQMLEMIPYLLDNPKFLAIVIRSIFDEVVPDYIAPILREGIADGSIKTAHPEALAEALLVLTNVWLSPILQPTPPEVIRQRCAVYDQITRAFGLELLDEELVEAIVQYGQWVQTQNDPRQ